MTSATTCFVWRVTTPPMRGASSDHVSPGMLRIFDRLVDTPAEIVTEIGETLRQTPLDIAVVGDRSHFVGLSRSVGYRWFTDPGSRDLHPTEDHDHYSRLYASGLREIASRRGPESRAAQLAAELRARSEEFRFVWDEHEVGMKPRELKRYSHPEVGLLELTCQTLLDPDQSHRLLVYTAVPGSESYGKLQLLSVIGAPRG